MNLKDDFLRLLRHNFPSHRDPQMLYEHQKMVLHKAAQPYDFTPLEFNLLHAALGLAAEVLELQQSSTRENTQEELGDLLWYLNYTASLLDITTEGMEQEFVAAELDRSTMRYHIKHSNSLPQKVLAAKVEEMVSDIKKRVIYQQDKNLEKSFVALWISFCYHCKACHFSLEQLITSNTKKLEERYKKSFTTEESASRNDKAKT